MRGLVSVTVTRGQLNNNLAGGRTAAVKTDFKIPMLPPISE